MSDMFIACKHAMHDYKEYVRFYEENVCLDQ